MLSPWFYDPYSKLTDQQLAESLDSLDNMDLGAASWSKAVMENALLGRRIGTEAMRTMWEWENKSYKLAVKLFAGIAHPSHAKGNIELLVGFYELALEHLGVHSLMVADLAAAVGALETSARDGAWRYGLQQAEE